MANPEINRLIDDLLTTASIQTDRRLIAELIRDAIKLGSDSTSTLNLKIASAAVSEMREAFAMFAPFS